jgi:hypothetical protein
MTRNNNRRRNNNRATNNIQHQNDSQNKAENKESEEENFDVDICSRLVESQVASNALTADDQCPICFIEWL